MLSRLREIVAAAPALLAGGNGGLLTARPPGESILGGCAPVAPPVTSQVAPPVVAPVALPAAWSDARPCTIVEREASISSLAPPPPRSGPSSLPSAKRRRTELPPIVEGAPVGMMQVPPPSPLHLPPPPSPLPPSPSISISTSLRLPPPLPSNAPSPATPPHPTLQDGGGVPLFKLTERGSLTPSGAETLTKRVGEARDDGALIVPQVNA